MTETETITVADVSDGPGGSGTDGPGTPVSLPVVELLTGRGFITGKSGSGKSNTASVVVENLLSNNFPILIVDTDGEYYGLKEEFELLHAGADDECDIQVSPEHAEKLASLALEGNVPIILDVSGYLDDDVAKELLLATARQLFAKEKKLKKPFLMLVEEVHEYIPEGGGLDETGRMLIKIGKRGRKHGLGIVGISQRPADVKKDFITQCDWLVWHRLTWNNDTKVVSRIIDAEHADAVEDLDDGEAFLMTDWSESVRRVQFHRKQTFDAGATPGLDDFERPELKSVNAELVDELRDITDERERRESELADLRQELEKKERRIRELEGELEEARDLKRMADKFAQAMLQKAEAPYRGGDPRSAPAEQADLYAYEDADAVRNGAEMAADADAASTSDGDAASGQTADVTIDPADGDNGAGDDADDSDAVEEDPDAVDAVENDAGAASDADDESGFDYERADWPDVSSVPSTTDGTTDAPEPGTRAAVVRKLRSRIEDLPDISLAMLRHYREAGTAEPVDAHVAAGGSSDSTMAYGRNRPLRRRNLIEHAGRDTYRYAVPDLVRDAYDDRLDGEKLGVLVAAVEKAFVEEETLAAEMSAGGPPADGEDDDVEFVDDESVEGDDGFVEEDAEIVEESYPTLDDAEDADDTDETPADEDDRRDAEIIE
ncbi:helicase HerA domain-containing protein [Salinirarus marinus]|uniref:helicase HerA domain-containing protein n=1 Tax=Salinirarus marinus TaxID=3068310 RepID=UPI003C6C34EC